MITMKINFYNFIPGTGDIKILENEAASIINFIINYSAVNPISVVGR